MGFLNTFSFEYRRYKCGRETVAGSDGICDFHFRRGLERYVAWSEHVAAVDAAGENEHFEIVFAEKNPAFVLKVDTG